MDKKNMDIDSLFEKTQEKKALKQQEEANRAYTLGMIPLERDTW